MGDIDFAAYCEQACRKFWGEPEKSKPGAKALRWANGAYAWRNYSIKKRCWYDSETKRGGSTLELAALALGLPADTKIEGDVFFRCWRYAAQHWDVPAPPEKPDQGDGKEKKQKKTGATKLWSPIVARYVYRQADGTPHLQVCRTEAKTFFQHRWNGQMWVNGKPDGPNIPYRLPELIAAPITAPVHIAEGEKDTDALAKHGFVATTNSGGAANWTDDLNEHFRDRVVFIHEDNDDDGRKRCQRIAHALDPIAKTVRVIRLPGLPPKGDVSDWLQDDPSGTRLVRECKSTPVWEPSTAPAPDAEPPADADAVPDFVAVKKKQADILIELASAAELFHDRDDVGYARFDVSGHHENWPIKSKGFKRWLTRGYYESTQSAPSSDAMQSALGVLEARAQFDAPEHDVNVRVAEHEGAIYIDLADKDWRAIEIDDDGWRVVDDAPVYFRRSSGMKPLPVPVAGGSLERDLRPLLNVKTDAEFVLTVSWLLAALRARGPYPMLDLAGEQGSAKSFRARILRATIDPNSVPLRSLPKNEHDVYIAARNSHVLAYDNASGLPDWLSDTFCRLATGGGFSTRQLYTDEDEVLFGSTRPIILNGIDDIVTRPDLADRSILQALAAILDDQRKLETALWESFEEKYPRILGALLTAVAHGLKTLPDVKLDRLPRMADFAVWVTACEGALWPKGTFMRAYAGNIAEAIEIVLDDDQVATALRAYMDGLTVDLEAQAPRFVGTAGDLLKALNGFVPENQQKAKGWPKRPAELAKILRRIAPPLRKVGVDIVFERDTRQKRTRKITITGPAKLAEMPSAPSAPSAANDINESARTAGDEAADRYGTDAVRNGANGIQADSTDGDADGNGQAAVRAKPLKDKEEDSADSKDSISTTLTGGRDPVSPPPPGAELVGRAQAGQRCHLCGSASGVDLVRRRPGEAPMPVHFHCLTTAQANAPQAFTCAQCGYVGGDLGGSGQVWTVAGLDVWLHDGGCETSYYDAHAGDPPPEDHPAEPPDQAEDGPPW